MARACDLSTHFLGPFDRRCNASPMAAHPAIDFKLISDDPKPNYVSMNESGNKETGMAKGEQKGNREAKKPKKEKIKTIAAAPSLKTGTLRPAIEVGKRK